MGDGGWRRASLRNNKKKKTYWRKWTDTEHGGEKRGVGLLHRYGWGSKGEERAQMLQ